MDYSQIHIAKKALEVAGISVPDNEREIREKAYRYLLPIDFVAAHSIRFKKNYRTFTKKEWQEVIQISGEDAIKDNIGAFVLCVKHGLLTL